MEGQTLPGVMKTYKPYHMTFGDQSLRVFGD